MNGVEPYAWLNRTLEKIAAGHPQARIRELLPWNFGSASSSLHGAPPLARWAVRTAYDCFVIPGNSSTKQTGELPWGFHET